VYDEIRSAAAILEDAAAFNIYVVTESGNSMRHSSLLTAIAAAIWLAGPQSGFASPAAEAGRVPQIPGTVTSMTSSAKRMISYRDQNHSWMTSDGAIHLMINLGTFSASNSLSLYSSFDNGATWNQQFILAQTDGASTDDGVLTNTPTGATLQLVYATSPNIGSIVYLTATYTAATQSWTLGTAQTAFKTKGIVASNPAFVADSDGNLWCGFTEENSATLQYQEDMIYQLAGTQTWTDTGLVFGPADNTTQHSARPVPYPGGVGVIYEVDNTLYWAYRLSGSAFNAPWVTSTIYTGLPPLGSDPFDTHYSVVADANDNLYLAFISAPADLSFAVFSSGTNTWGNVATLQTSINSPAYPQVSLAGSTLILMANYLGSVQVLQSADSGNTFTTTQFLTHPPAQNGVSYGKPRVEAPRYATTSYLPVWQQFVDGITEELLYFSLPVPN
jgi:hypothetical protein